VCKTRETCIGWEAQVPCVAARYELATLYKSDKQPGKARQQLDELLALWRSADADLPLLESARKLRTELDGERDQGAPRQ